jgi:hypothetical protein
MSVAVIFKPKAMQTNPYSRGDTLFLFKKKTFGLLGLQINTKKLGCSINSNFHDSLNIEGSFADIPGKEKTTYLGKNQIK